MMSHIASAENDITLRPATATDVRMMAVIEQSAFSDPWPESAFADFLVRAHVRMMVAIDHTEAVVGYCVMLVMADEAEIANIAVAMSARRKGIAGRLLDDAVRVAQAGGATAIYLEVRTSNTAARELYASRQFRLIGRRRAYYQNPGEDALVLRWLAPSSELRAD